MISVVIPTHNRADALQSAIQSVFAQSELPGEVLVVDDGSAPSVGEEVFLGAPDGLSCRLIRHDVPRGANVARNAGCLSASGEYIAFLDDDDQFLSEKVAQIKEAIASAPDTDVFYHPALIRFVCEGLEYVSSPGDVSSGESIFNQLLLRNLIGGTSMATIRRSTLLEAGGFDESMPALQDYELWLRLAQAGRQFTLIPTPLTAYAYVSGDRSITKSLSRNRAAYALIEQKFAREFAGLSTSQKQTHESRKTAEFAFKCVLNGHRYRASGYYLQLLRQQPSMRNLALLGLSLLGRYPLLYVRSKI